MNKTYDVSSICNALVDVLVEVPENFISELGLQKGIMHLVDSKRQAVVLSQVKNVNKTIELGGSAMNAIRALAAIGKKCFFVGCVSDDEFGGLIRTRMAELNIESQLETHVGNKDLGTGTCLILITPDGERTMNTDLGSSRYYSENISYEKIATSKVFHFSGYQWDTDSQKKVILKALETAKKSGTKVSFDVADPFAVGRHREDFLMLIRDYADIVFANQEEAKILGNKNPEEVALEIGKADKIAVVKVGSKGAVICQNGKIVKIAPVSTNVIDTTAAGDLFAAGFLYGTLENKNHELAGKMAATLASDVISRLGAHFSTDVLEKIKTF